MSFVDFLKIHFSKDSLESEYAKAQIPHEHLVLQETFDSIVVRCKNASSNPVSTGYNCYIIFIN